MLDYEGNMINNKDRVKIILEELVLDKALTASMKISEVESQQLDRIVESTIPVGESDTDDLPVYENVPTEFIDVITNLCSVNRIYDAEVMCSKLCERGDNGRFKASIGSCNVTEKSCLLGEATVTTADLTDDENSLSDDSSIDLDEDTGTDPYFNDWEEQIQATLEADEYMASAAHANPRKIVC